MTGRIRCAVYTRKSSEEGLDQTFNSLDAQREACEAFIQSQKHEGWMLIPTKFDDGGFSGGNMDRPALKKLMADIAEGRINTVVVYKVDRLTRSLADFAKIIEQFDSKGVNFVSVTQQFNTTTSMGRLTLNVLLSFAQFEREVTGERIRDKIAASKAKGMWMGGRVPFGYDLRDRKLLINAREAEQVQEIFRQYLRVRTVPALTSTLIKSELRTKVRVSPSGFKTGGESWSRGALYELLRNNIYVGEIKHKNSVYRGEHPAIVDRKLWDEVQNLLDQNRQGTRVRPRTESGSLLTGLLFDQAGVRYIPTHAQKAGRKYHYYTSQAAIRENRKGVLNARLPAAPLERAVLDRIREFLRSPEEVLKACNQLDIAKTDVATVLKELERRGSEWDRLSDKSTVIQSVISRVVVREDSLEVEMSSHRFLDFLLAKSTPGLNTNSRAISLTTSFRRPAHGNALRLVIGSEPSECAGSRDAIAKAIARARSWHYLIVEGRASGLAHLARQEGLTLRYVKNIFPLALLGPQAVDLLLNSREGRGRTLDSLMGRVPLMWDRQVAFFRSESSPAR